MRALLTTLVSLCVFACPFHADAKPPNLVLILADDLGYEAIGANGGTSYRTPVLDRLAATGARFTHCYVQPLCTPTRVQLMTGQYNVRNYIRFGAMDPKSVTFANLLQRAGYKTCIAGKWQLGRDPALPKQFGFDEHCLWQHTRRPPRYANPGLEVNGVEKDYTHGEYGPDLVNDYALDFIRRHKDTPFLLYYPMTLTHAPYQPTPDSPTWDPTARGETVHRRPEHFADMVAYMDKLVGKVVAQLEALGLRTNTLVMFLGDNGTGRGVESQLGVRTVRGGKGQTLTTGMHVPLIACWPGTIAAGKVPPDLVDSTDVLPTLCAAAGVALPSDLKVDGRSFLPQLRGEPGQPREWIYSWYSPRQNNDTNVQEFAFNQRYKLYRDGRFFDLARDEDERRPLRRADLTGPAASAARSLQSALDQFQNARPDRPSADAGLVAPADAGIADPERYRLGERKKPGEPAPPASQPNAKRQGQPTGSSAVAPAPNILFVLSDDHSYPFLGCYGDANVRTPTLDRLAAGGMKFHRFFTTAPQCVPSRASLLTGRSPVAARITRFSSPPTSLRHDRSMSSTTLKPIRRNCAT